MRRTIVVGLALLCIGCERAPQSALTCDGAMVLSQAADAYRNLTSLTDVAEYDVHIPNAPVHYETSEFGFAPNMDAYIRMPGLYVMTVQGNRALVASDDSNAARAMARPATSDLQATLDGLFENHGPPLAPAPLLLRAGAGANAFQSKLLHPLHVTGCAITREGDATLHEVTLTADNGAARARFDASSHLLHSYSGEIALAPNVSLTANVHFRPTPNGRLPDLSRLTALPRVEHFVDLSSRVAAAHTDALAHADLVDLNGQLVSLTPTHGEILIVDFWARWCAPCRVTLPAVQRVQAWAKAQNLPVRVVFVNTEERFASAAAARQPLTDFLRASNLEFETALDLDAHFHRRFDGGLPLTLVFSPTGALINREQRYSADVEAVLRDEITAALAPPPAAH